MSLPQIYKYYFAILFFAVFDCQPKKDSSHSIGVIQKGNDSLTILADSLRSLDKLKGLIESKKGNILFLDFWMGMSQDEYLSLAKWQYYQGKLGRFSQKRVTENYYEPELNLFYYSMSVKNNGTIEDFVVEPGDSGKYSSVKMGVPELVTLNLQLIPYFIGSKLESISVYNWNYRSPNRDRNAIGINQLTLADGDSESAIRYRQKENYFSEKLVGMYKSKYGDVKPKQNISDKEYELRWNRQHIILKIYFTQYYGYTSLKCIKYLNAKTEVAREQRKKREADSLKKVAEKIQKEVI